MLTVDQAEKIIFGLVPSLDLSRDTEVLALLQANGRILAEPVVSQLDFPHWDNSAMDGYAVRFADVQACTPEQPVTLEIIEEIPAGYQPQRTVAPGQAARILTGAVMPTGADTIVIQENTQRDNGQVIVQVAPQPQAFVRHRASFYRAGQPLLPAGLQLSAPEIAVLAAAQCAQVKVYRRLRVAILSTGDELVDIDQPLQPGQIVDSNRYALAALVQQLGAEVVVSEVVLDRPDALKQAIARAISTADVVLSSGGVSVGDYDYVDTVLAEVGAEIHIRSIAVKPGKPLTVATFANNHQPTLYFGLPGNPVSALVTFWRFVQPALKKLAGLAQGWQPEFLKARTVVELRSDGKRESYLWGQLRLANGSYEFHLAGGSHSSGNLINLAQTNSLAVVPIGCKAISAGELVDVLQLRSI
jgi:molybdopterin molybdotransferase